MRYLWYNCKINMIVYIFMWILILFVIKWFFKIICTIDSSNCQVIAVALYLRSDKQCVKNVSGQAALKHLDIKVIPFKQHSWHPCSFYFTILSCTTIKYHTQPFISDIIWWKSTYLIIYLLNLCFIYVSWYTAATTDTLRLPDCTVLR